MLLPLILAPVMTWKLDSTVISCIKSVGRETGGSKGGGGERVRVRVRWKEDKMEKIQLKRSKVVAPIIIIYVYGNVTRNWTREADADAD